MPMIFLVIVVLIMCHIVSFNEEAVLAVAVGLLVILFGRLLISSFNENALANQEILLRKIAKIRAEKLVILNELNTMEKKLSEGFVEIAIILNELSTSLADVAIENAVVLAQETMLDEINQLNHLIEFKFSEFKNFKFEEFTK